MNGDLKELEGRVTDLEASYNERSGAIKMGKWMLALIITLGSIGMYAYNVFLK